MRQRGAPVSDTLAVGARSLIRDELGYEATRYVFGRGAEVLRRMHDDHQVQQALDFARRARAPQDLFALVTSGSAQQRSP
jgi:hypothetical protein